MKLKQQPSDFIVEEIPDIEITHEKDAHTIYLLEKQNLDTFEALRLLAKKLRISLFEIGYAGLKDKHSISKQYISIPTQYNVPMLKTDNIAINPVGYHNKKIKIGDLKGNRFAITVRDVKHNEVKEVMARAQTIPSCGVPNYFDSQRFGSVINNVFIAKHLIHHQYEQAVKHYLTAYQKSEPKTVKDEKRRLHAQWNRLEQVQSNNKVFAGVIKEYVSTHDWCAAYKKIPAHLREMYVNAYQSYLWNECVKETLKRCVQKKKLYPVEYAVGSLLFYIGLSSEEKALIPETFRTVSDTARFSAFEQQIVETVLAREGITLRDLAIETSTGNFFKARPRPVLLFPEDFMIGEPEKDELNDTTTSSRYKIRVVFRLPKGCYATVVTKRLFGH